MKWLWRLQQQEPNQWAQAIAMIYGTLNASTISNSASASFFVKGLGSLHGFYECSTTVEIGTGVTKWTWAANGKFSCASAYRALHDRGLRCPHQNALWKLNIPAKVRIFLWLLLQDSVMTLEVLERRGCPTTRTSCILCSSGMQETRDHIIWNCAYAKLFWRGLLPTLNLPQQMYHQVGFIEAWKVGRDTLQGEDRARWNTGWAAGCWALWRERNRRTFSQKSKIVPMLINDTAREVREWTSNI